MFNMTLTNVRLALALRGVSIRKRDGEYRVNAHGAPEETAYYTDDLEDAYLTGIVAFSTEQVRFGN